MLLKPKDNQNKKKKPLGIYVHVPFCRSKCEYCDFYSLGGARNKELMDRYLTAVLAHIRERHALVLRSRRPEPHLLRDRPSL